MKFAFQHLNQVENVMGELLPRVYLIVDALWRRRYLIVLPILLMPVAGGLVINFFEKKKDPPNTKLGGEKTTLKPIQLERGGVGEKGEIGGGRSL